MAQPPRSKVTLPQAFRFAFCGIGSCIGGQRNMKIHLAVAALVVIAGFLCQLQPLEWCAVVLCIGMVCALECVNTAVEAAVDLTTEDYHPLAKVAKDCAAGAVLIAAIASVVVGLIVFIGALLRLVS